VTVEGRGGRNAYRGSSREEGVNKDGMQGREPLVKCDAGKGTLG
jgi:hypothetical protein